MLEVYKLVRTNNHKVAVPVAYFGKNHQGSHYGFKLHASINLRGKLCALLFAPASYSDTQAMPYLVNSSAKLDVGDTLYGARVMRKFLYRLLSTFFITPPYPQTKKKLITSWQYKLLTLRPKIESVFGYLKNHLHLVSSFPRSVKGFALHYLRILLGFQLLVGQLNFGVHVNNGQKYLISL